MHHRDQHTDVLILGGGFAGARCALTLSELGIPCTLVDKSDGIDCHHDLYEVAASPLNPNAVRMLYRHLEHFSYSSILARKRVNHVKAVIQQIHLGEKSVTTTAGNFTCDKLVIALGGRPADFLVPGAHEYSMKLWGLEDAFAIHDAIFHLARRRRGHIAIFGGDFLGCELAGEVAKQCRGKGIRLTVIEAASHVLGGIPHLATKAEKRLSKLGVHLMLDTPASLIEDGKATLKKGKVLHFDLAVWACGVQGNYILGTMGLNLAKGNFVDVDNHLRIPKHKDVFCIGDAAHCFDRGSRKPYPKLATIALVMGDHTARNIQRLKKRQELKPFHTHTGPIAVPLGGAYALVLQKSAGLAEGLPGWVVRRGLNLDLLQEFFPHEKSYELLQEQEEAYEGIVK
jgi:NADH dehydrogenase